ncbi:MAG: FtsK/SpoIIIE domain-containing protein [Actinomycetota bacterium]
MRFLLTFDGIGDCVIDTAGDATVGDVVAAVGGDRSSDVHIERTNQTVGPTSPIAEVDLRSGDRLALLPPTNAPATRGAPDGGVGGQRPAALLRIVRGPDAPAAIELGFGEFTIGRGLDCDVVVTDDTMSRRHASIVVDDESAEIIDLGSRHGVRIDSQITTGAAALTGDSTAVLGHTSIRVEHLRRARGLGDLSGASVPFNRPPRLVLPYEPRKTKLPRPPDDPPRQRLPMISALAPLLMGAAMIYAPVAFGGEPNYLFGLFMLFSPVMMIGSYLESRSASRAAHRASVNEFELAMIETENRLDQLHAEEQLGRRSASPPVDALATAVDELSPRLWERALDDEDVLSLRIGLADLASVNTIEVPDGGARSFRHRITSLPERYETVSAVPLTVDLHRDRGIGITGPRQFTEPLAYSLVTQLAALHSPAELLLAAMVPAPSRPAWEWMKWLPHCATDDSVIGGHPLAADEGACRSLLARLLKLVDSRAAARTGFGDDSAVVGPAVVVVVAEGLPVEQRELTRLLEQGPSVGVYTMWLSAASRRVPRGVGNVVRIEPGGETAEVGTTASGVSITNVRFETSTRSDAEATARRLSPIEDVGALLSAGSMVPARVSLIELLGGLQLLESDDDVLAHWSRRPKTLEAPVGRLAEGVFTLDIRRDGPHGLVGGTTGAGKSEFLQSWVMGMATTHAPETVTFLLVDYKGGAAFKDCSKLPHTVGMVTDLDNAGVRRALVSLRAELHHRELLFAEHDCSDLLEMIDKKIPDTPPSLLIIVDEFAALVQEVPEFVEGMVDVAQRGRSLGLHLVLATQRPAGVITPQVKANTDLRIALRMADTDDSTDVIEAPDAAEIDRKLPGRAIAKISRDRFTFQSAYVGGVTNPDEAPTVEAGRLEFGYVDPIALPVTEPAAPTLDGANAEPPATDLERLVAHLCAVHHRTGRPLPRKPWLEPLAPIYDLAGLEAAADDHALILGVADRPERQTQQPLRYEPDTDGGLGIVGTGGSGKTVALRSIAAAAALHGRVPAEVGWVYGIDYGGRGLRVLESLPHVGTIAYEDDVELTRRMLADLESTLDERVEQFSSERAASLAEFRAARRDVSIGRIYLLIDNYPSFHEAFEPLENERFIRIVRRLVLEGRPVGIHVVVTAPRRDAMSFTVQRAFGRWLALRQNSVEDYRGMEVPIDVLTEASPPGAAIDGANAAQLAVLGGGPSSDEQDNAMQALAAQLTADGVALAPPIRLLPESLSRSDLTDPTAIGLRDRDFAEYRLPDGFRLFLVSGPRASGRSTVAVALGQATAARFDEVVFLSMKRPSVPVEPSWRTVIGQDDLMDEAYGMEAGSGQTRLLILDDAYAMVEAGIPVDQLVDAADGEHTAVIVVLEDVRARSGYDPLVRAVTAHKLGLLLRPSPLEDADVFGLAMPRIKSHLWPLGRGYLVDGQAMDTLQVAAPTKTS